MKVTRYFVVGWSKRFGDWVTESVETTSAQLAKEHMKVKYPSLTKLKTYVIRTEM
jgi:hypothetical protein